LDKLLSMSDVEIDVVQDLEKMRPVDVPVIEADIIKLKKDVGWKQKISLEQSLLYTFKYWINREEA